MHFQFLKLFQVYFLRTAWILCICLFKGGRAVPGTTGGAVQETGGGGEGKGGPENPRGEAEVGDAEDGKERFPGEGK